jgi:hypothetical protein
VQSKVLKGHNNAFANKLIFYKEALHPFETGNKRNCSACKDNKAESIRA